MPVSPYLRSPCECCARPAIKKIVTARVEGVPIARWPISANGNIAENIMLRLGQFRARTSKACLYEGEPLFCFEHVARKRLRQMYAIHYALVGEHDALTYAHLER